VPVYTSATVVVDATSVAWIRSVRVVRSTLALLGLEMTFGAAAGVVITLTPLPMPPTMIGALVIGVAVEGIGTVVMRGAAVGMAVPVDTVGFLGVLFLDLCCLLFELLVPCPTLPAASA
jgi:hypothetical protein